MSNLIGRMPPQHAPVRTGPEAPPGGAERRRIDVFTWDLFENETVQALVTTRAGGVSGGRFGALNLGLHVGDDDRAVVENRRLAVRVLGAGLDDLVVAEQIHGATAAVVGRADAGRGARSAAGAVPGADALVTTEPGLVLAVLAADCAPVALYDPVARVLGCVHAGWRGALSGVLEAAVATMTSLGARPERLLAGIGPTIAAHRYEVGPDVLAAATEVLGSAEPWCRPGRPGHWWFDLAGAVSTLLRRAGVDLSRLETAPVCTGPPGPFYSFRAEGTCGRFALLARIGP